MPILDMDRGASRFLALSICLQVVACSFSLNTVVRDYWYYVDNHLAETTSQGCLDAYNAPIYCDMTLLGLVASGSPSFNPGPDDFTRTCDSLCGSSLFAYVANLKSYCTQAGDGALVEANAITGPKVVPVAVVGEVFQYTYTFGCSKDSSGWCYLNYPSSPEWARTDFACSNECAVQFFTNAHELAGANYSFAVYGLNRQSDWWDTQFSKGWEHVLECKTLTTSGTSTSQFSAPFRVSSATLTPDNTSKGDIQSTATTTTSSVSSTGETTTVTTSLPTITSNSNAQRLSLQFWRLL